MKYREDYIRRFRLWILSFVQRISSRWTSKKYNLASYIKIEEGQVFFNLDEQALGKIHQVKARNLPLYIPCSLRILLLRHALPQMGIVTPNRRKKASTYLLPGLTFYTYYSDEQADQKLGYIYFTPSTPKKKLLRSLISPDGDILNQICSSSLQHPYFSEISTAHHWLITQLINHLHANLNWIPQLIWGALTVGYVGWRLGIQNSAIMKFVGVFVPPLLLRVLWMWLQPLIVRQFLKLVLSFLVK